jgi:hypothetical protein
MPKPKGIGKPKNSWEWWKVMMHWHDKKHPRRNSIAMLGLGYVYRKRMKVC